MQSDGDGDTVFRPMAVKRVVDIFDHPQFFIDGPTANDVRQGRDGDCWLMAALCTLSNKPGLIERCCVEHNQEVGVYGFVFHRDGEWFSEIIDDKVNCLSSLLRSENRIVDLVQLYLTKPDYDESLFERILWEDRDRVNSEEAYRKIYQSNSGSLVSTSPIQLDDDHKLSRTYSTLHNARTPTRPGFRCWKRPMRKHMAITPP